jgi:hypothetical protein
MEDNYEPQHVNEFVDILDVSDATGRRSAIPS